MQSAYLCVIVHVKQLPFLAVFTWFLVLGKIQDGDHCWWRHRPPAAPPFVKYTSSYYKTLGRGSGGSRGGVRGARSPLFFDQNEARRAEKNFFWDRAPSLSHGLDDRPPPPLIWRTGWGVWFCVYVRGSSGFLKLWQGSGWFCMRLHLFIKASFIIDTKGLYCVTKGNISFSSLSFFSGALLSFCEFYF